jgi:hypothetical protein
VEKQYIYFVIATISFILNTLLICYFLKLNPRKNSNKPNKTESLAKTSESTKSSSIYGGVDRDIVSDPNADTDTYSVVNTGAINSMVTKTLSGDMEMDITKTCYKENAEEKMHV